MFVFVFVLCVSCVCVCVVVLCVSCVFMLCVSCVCALRLCVHRVYFFCWIQHVDLKVLVLYANVVITCLLKKPHGNDFEM